VSEFFVQLDGVITVFQVCWQGDAKDLETA
jgi:hypothetical protein